MTEPDAARRIAIALDGGTSTTRARLVEGGRIVAESRRSVGVRDAVISGEPSPLAAAVRACLDDLTRADPRASEAPIVAAGMLSAEVGLVAVPHVVAPAGLEELARAASSRVVPEVSDRPILFIPGVRTPPGDGPDGWAEADLMRGEECETLGAMLTLGIRGPVAFLWPGSHSKLVEVDASGRIVRSYTTLAGEITATLASSTIIAKSLPGGLPDRPIAEALASGVRLASREGLGRAAFLVRIADVTGALDLEGRASFWVGAVIGDDAGGLAKHPIWAGGVPLFVGGREPQRSAYLDALRAARGGGCPVEALEGDLAGRASAVGAVAVGAASGLFSRR